MSKKITTLVLCHDYDGMGGVDNDYYCGNCHKGFGEYKPKGEHCPFCGYKFEQIHTLSTWGIPTNYNGTKELKKLKKQV